MAQILRFAPPAPRSADWSQLEIAEFYRVESALTQAGVALDVERGLTDEGDPWFAFCRQDNGEVFVHFARIDGEYLIDGTGLAGVARGRDFSVLVRTLISGEALQFAKLRPANGNVFLHPAALLIALVGAAFFHSGEVKAAEAAGQKSEVRRATGFSLTVQSKNSEPAPVGLDASQSATVMAGVLIGIDEQRMLPVAEAPPPAPPPGPTGLSVSLPAAETMTSLTTRAAAPSPGSALASEAQPFVAHSVAALTQLAPPPALGDGSLAKVAGLMQAAAPPSVALAGFAAGAAPAPVLDRHYFIASDANALPSDEAGQIVRDLSSGAADPHSISLTDKLPTLMADVIHRGSQVSSTPQATAPVTPLPSGGAANGTSVSVPTPSPSPPPSSPGHHDPAIDQAVTTFMGAVSHWGIVVNGDSLVIYDTDIFAPHSAALDSVTFTFSDGSSISLVGTAVELSSTHILH